MRGRRGRGKHVDESREKGLGSCLVPSGGWRKKTRVSRSRN